MHIQQDFPVAGANVRRLTHVPDLLALHAAEPERFPFLLESAATGGSAQRTLGQYDILFCEPGETVALRSADPRDAQDFFDLLNTLAPAVRAADASSAEPDLPFRGGWFVFATYELAAQVEPVLRLCTDSSLPLALAARVSKAVVVCRQTQRAWLVSEDDNVDGLLHDVQRQTSRGQDVPLEALIGHLQEEDPEQFLDGVVTAKAHIAAGDVFQVNLSREWHAALLHSADPVRVYRQLRQTNPAPFAGLMLVDGHYTLSSSPERLAALDFGRIDTRPIAGTRPRGVEPDHDQALAIQLVEHPKERAEHVMLIDLERNDLGRVCRAGTVRVDEFMAVESYAHVHHIVSNVSGELDKGVGPGDALRAVYPGGTITGCPKVRCMQIIADLEQAPRGAYTGTMGYLNRDGSGDFNILIRTAVVADNVVRFRAGAGIVSDSVPGLELDETRAKARGLRLALTGA